MGRKSPSRVRIPPSPLAVARLLCRLFAPVAQLDRASVYGTEGQRFESSRARTKAAASGGFLYGSTWGGFGFHVPNMSRISRPQRPAVPTARRQGRQPRG